MGFKMIIQQVLRRSSITPKAFRLPENLHISYNHNDNKFNINISRNSLQLEDTEQFKETRPKEVNSQLLCFNVNKEDFIESTLQNIFKNESKTGRAQNILLDFSSPNIAKPFHMGHLRSTIIGDWGTQFGLLQYGLLEKKINIEDLKTNPIKNLYEIYVDANKLASKDPGIQEQARKYFADIEQGKLSLDNWKSIRAITMEELKRVYHRLGISFDAYHWESDYNGTAIKDLMELLEKNGIIKSDRNGKMVATFHDRDIPIMKSDKTTLYLSRDIAALLDRYKKYKFDKMLYIVDNSQSDHFAALISIVSQINESCARGCEHVKFGRIKGMSTRSGNVVFLNDILDEAKRKMFDKQQISKNTRNTAMNEETCDTLGTTAVIINDLKQRRQKDYIFEWDRALQSEGDSGIKLQYLHCRLWSLEKNALVPIADSCDSSYLKEEIIGLVVAELAKFEYVLHRSLLQKEACIIVNYLFRLSKNVNKMFNEIKVKNVNSDLASQRLLVFHISRLVVKTSLEILGVKPLYEM